MIIFLIAALAILGIYTEKIHKKMRSIINEEGYKLGYYIRYYDIKKFLDDENSAIKKDELKRLARKWLYLVASAVLVIVISIIFVMLFPSIV